MKILRPFALQALLLFFCAVLPSLLFAQASADQPAAQASVSGPQAAGGDHPAFEVASVKPNPHPELREFIQLPAGRFVATDVTAKTLIQFAYNLQPFQLAGGPGWLGSDRYDVDAKEPDAVAKKLQGLALPDRMDDLRLMLQALLAERFQLRVSHQSKDAPVYLLVVAKGGPKLTPTTLTPAEQAGEAKAAPGQQARGPRLGITGSGQITGLAMPVSALAEVLSHQLGQQVLDHTNLTAKYDYKLQWTPDETQLLGGGDTAAAASGNAPLPDSSGPSIFTAIEEQLGLKLEAGRGSVDTVVIEHIEEPSEN